MTQATHYTPEGRDHDEAYLGGLVVELRDEIARLREHCQYAAYAEVAAERDRLRWWCIFMQARFTTDQPALSAKEFADIEAALEPARE